jgi:hypothetical protein
VVADFRSLDIVSAVVALKALLEASLAT